MQIGPELRSISYTSAQALLVYSTFGVEALLVFSVCKERTGMNYGENPKTTFRVMQKSLFFIGPNAYG